MKYMGSKRWMLENGLSKIIGDKMDDYDRFVDLFCGSSAVSWYVSQNFEVPVLANDLQEFCRRLAASVICRTSKLGELWIKRWITRAVISAESDPLFDSVEGLQSNESQSLVKVTKHARGICSGATTPITAAYGGYYFSPIQAMHFDYLRKSIPQDRARKYVALAALIEAASRCAASPGHTAQPFSPTTTAGPYLQSAWALDVLEHTKKFAILLSDRVSHCMGTAIKGDANKLASKLGEGDLVFLDPPYSSVHYSRFYHVLETVAEGVEVNVRGTGRYPPPESRPRSRYSLPSEALGAIRDLLQTIRSCRSGVLITFPAGRASNGLSGMEILDLARQWYKVDYTKIESKFSTMGGNKRNRSARMKSEELLLSLVPK